MLPPHEQPGYWIRGHLVQMIGSLAETNQDGASKESKIMV